MVGTPTKVTWLTQGWPSEARPMAGIFHKAQVLALNEMNLNINVVTPVPWVPPLFASLSPKWRRFKSLPHEYVDENISIMQPRYPAIPKENNIFLNHFSIYHRLKPLLKAKRPDIIHAHFAYSTGAVAAMFKRETGTPYVLTLHGDDVTEYPHRCKRALSLYRFALSHADKVLAVSPSLARKSKQLYDVEVEVVPNGLDCTNFNIQKTKKMVRDELGLAHEKFIVLFVGNLTAEKGVPILVKALQSINNSKILSVFLGDGSEKGILKTQLPGCLALGVQPHFEIAKWMRAADVFVLPSLHEGLGQVIVEAGVIGLPVVGSNTGGITDLLRDGRGELVTPGDVDGFAKAIEEIRQDSSVALNKASRLNKYVKSQHDVQITAKKTQNIYREVISE